MNTLEKIISNIVFALHILLLFLLIFEQQLELPVAIQSFGRLHPLLLHFPIGLLVLLGLIQIIKNETEPRSFHKIQGFVLLLTVFTTSLTAIMGFFLSQEEGYASTTMTWHKWTGVALSFLVYGLFLFASNQRSNKWMFSSTLVASIIILLIAGHLGASITHGADFVLAPLKSEQPKITEATTIFAAAIHPILEDKCYACHNDRKTKGDLNMTSVENLLKGGKNGSLWEAGDAANSHLLQRINLPVDHEDHMPPEGKPQLTAEEIALIHQWIETGASTDRTLATLNPGDSLYQLTMSYVQSNNEGARSKDAYDFQPASPITIESLNNPFRTVMPIAASSPALHAQIFVRQAYKSSYLDELEAVKKQIVELNLSNLPIQDEDLKQLKQFDNLQKLILNGTDITGATLDQLANCKNLKSLAVSNTEVGENFSKALDHLPNLKQVYLWSTRLDTGQINQLRQRYSHITFYEGYIPNDNEILPLSAPALENETLIIAANDSIRIKHAFRDANIRYTLDGTDPDSLNSLIYQQPVPMDSFTTLKAKAFKAGWLSSDVKQWALYKKQYQPMKVELINPPDPKYPAKESRTLFDDRKGEPFLLTQDWLGYQDQPFIALLDFGETPPLVNHLTLSYGKMIRKHIMPPQWVEVWGGNDRQSMKRLQRITLTQPSKYQGNNVEGIDLAFAPARYRMYKVIAQPLQQLPQWHNAKGDKAWVFIDELFVYQSSDGGSAL
ncbi:MAG: c-type cytochrome domain-containing protein [Candidatus Cyclobacteriaceae bacterium M3_2C_046]